MSSPYSQPPPPESPPPVPGPPPAVEDQNTWAMLCHLSTFAGLIGVPLGNVLGPLIVWLVKKDQMPLVDDQGKEALNFQLSLLIYSIVGVILCVTVILLPIGVPLLIGLFVFDVVITSVAAVKANQGIAYRHPLCIRFLT